MTLDRDEIDRRKKVVVQQHGNHVHEEHVVRDINLEYRESVYKVVQFVWLLFGALEGLIAVRMLLKLIGANPTSWFAALVYQLSDLFLWPFQNLTINPFFGNFVFELTSLIALLVYALIGWGLVRLIWVLFYLRPTTHVTTYDREDV
jgi:uncharacterized protein YggT (Ycf19 family)